MSSTTYLFKSLHKDELTMDQKNGWTNYKLDLPGMRGGNSGRCDSGSEGLLATRSGKGKAQGDNTILQTITIQTGLPGVRNSLYVQVTTDVDLPCSFPHRWTAIKAPTAKDAHLAKAKVWGIQWLMVYGIPEEGSNSLSHTAVFIRPKQTPPEPPDIPQEWRRRFLVSF